MNAKRHLRRGALVALASCSGIVARSAEPAAPDPDSGHPGKISSQITEAVSATVPKYAATPPGKATESPGQAGVGASHSEDVLQLPNMQVTTPKNLPGSEYDWLTPKGRLDLALKNLPGIGLGNISGLNAPFALALQTEERRAQETAALVAQVQGATMDDSPEARKIRRLLEAAIQRPNSDWKTARGGKPGRP